VNAKDRRELGIEIINEMNAMGKGARTVVSVKWNDEGGMCSLQKM